MKCWISTFNAQGSRGIIIVVQVGVVKIGLSEPMPMNAPIVDDIVLAILGWTQTI
jgi:hypothetical protein